MSAPVEVVAVGARTPLGFTAPSSAAAVRAGICRYAEYPFIDVRGEQLVVAADGLLDTRLEGRERLLPMAESVLGELEERLGEKVFQGVRLRLLLALPEPRPGFSEDDAAWVIESLSARLRVKTSQAAVELAGRGHAGAIRAVEQAMKECAGARDVLCLVVGADSYHHPATFMWLERARRFAQPGIRSGFTPGEGAGGLALLSPGLRRRLGLTPLALVRGAGTAQEARLRESETGSFGVGMTQAVRSAMAGLELPREAVDAVYTDINGERYRSEEWAFVALRAPGVWKAPGYKAPSDCWGDVGAASGALGAILAIQSFARGYAKGPRALVMAGSDSGLRGAMLLQAPQVS
jgi:3-oxoacyl-[acyl-carrier-protein] synthase-1